MVLEEIKSGKAEKLSKCPFCTSIAIDKYCTTLYCPGPKQVNTTTKFTQTYRYQEMLMNFINNLNENFSIQCSKRLDSKNNKKSRCGKCIHMLRDRKNDPFLIMDCTLHREECPFYSSMDCLMLIVITISITR